MEASNHTKPSSFKQLLAYTSRNRLGNTADAARCPWPCTDFSAGSCGVMGIYGIHPVKYHFASQEFAPTDLRQRVTQLNYAGKKFSLEIDILRCSITSIFESD